MTEKLLTFPSPTPLSYLPRPWGWGLKVEIQLFSSTASTQPNISKDFVPGHHAQIQEFLSGGGGGVGVRAPQLILQFKEVLLHISQGGGGQLFPGVGVQ